MARRLRELERAGALSGHQAVSDFVPAARGAGGKPRADAEARLRRSRCADAHADRGRLPPRGGQGVPGDFDRASRPVSVADWLASPLSTPYRYLWAPAGDAVPASVVTLIGERDPARINLAAAGLDGVTLVDKASSVSRTARQVPRVGGAGPRRRGGDDARRARPALRRARLARRARPGAARRGAVARGVRLRRRARDAVRRASAGRSASASASTTRSSCARASTAPALPAWPYCSRRHHAARLRPARLQRRAGAAPFRPGARDDHRGLSARSLR